MLPLEFHVAVSVHKSCSNSVIYVFSSSVNFQTGAPNCFLGRLGAPFTSIAKFMTFLDFSVLTLKFEPCLRL